jgi:preprotein translocase subunit SecF
MRIIGDTNIPFLKYRGIALSISLLVILAGIGVYYWGPGLNLGIDFVGGTQVTLKFREEPDLDRIRSTLSNLETGTPSIQQFDETEKHEILIRVQNPGGVEGDFTAPILKLLNAEYNRELNDRFDLNIRGAKELTDLLVEVDPAGIDYDSRSQEYQKDADAVLQFRRTNIQFSNLDQVDEIEGIRDEVRSYLKENMAVGAYSLLGVDSVGPSVGKDLRDKAIMAIAFSLVGMLVYIWIRFQLPYGLGAVAALFHDVLITLTALTVWGLEINLPTVAALLTLVGYSVNDSVVVFDRVRENLRMRRGEDLEDLMNASINQTLSRTLITSGTTLVVVLFLYLFGGDVINTFAFVLLVGIIVGTYSSVFVASPVALSVSRVIIKRRAARSRR